MSVCVKCVSSVCQVQKIGFWKDPSPNRRGGEEEEEKEEEEEALCLNAGLAYSFALFELNP